MTQYNTLNVTFSNLQFSQLKSVITLVTLATLSTEVTLKFSSNVVGDSNDEINFPHKLLLTNQQVSRLRKAFLNNSSANIKLSKIQLSKVVQSGGCLGRLLRPLLKTVLLLMKNILKPLAKSILIPLRLTAAVSAIDAAIHKNIFGSCCPLMLTLCPLDLAPLMTTLIITNEEMNDII